MSNHSGMGSKRLPLDDCFLARTDKVETIQKCLSQAVSAGKGNIDSTTCTLDEGGTTSTSTSTSTTTRVIFVSGESGVGKTRLIQKAVASNNSRLWIGSGKFDSSAPPLEAIQTCVGQIADYLRGNSNSNDTVKKEMTELLEMDHQKVLQKVIPSTRLLFHPTTTSSKQESKAETDSTAPQSARDSIASTTTTEQDHSESLVASSELNSNNSQKQEQNQHSSEDHKEMLQRLQLAIQRFLSILSKHRPVLWVLDDLQWCDQDSFDLLTSILAPTTAITTDNTDCSNMILCATFRDNEVTDDLRTFQNTLQTRLHHETNNSCVQNLKLSTFSLDQVQQLLAELFGVDNNNDTEKRLSDLAKLIHERTNGNIFFIRQLLDNLQQEQLIVYDWMTLQWSYNLQKVQESANLSENVLQVVVKKIQRLDSQVQQLLQLCALLRTTRISTSSIQICQSAFSDIANDDSHDLLERAYKEKLLLKDTATSSSSSSETLYKFSHDKVFESVCSMLPSGIERQLLHTRIGNLLWDSLRQRTKERPQQQNEIRSSNKKSSSMRLWFICADQMNMGQEPTQDQERWKLVQLNYKTARYASQMSAYRPALRYCQVALKVLPSDAATNRQQEYKNLVLDLYVLSAEMCYCTGNLCQTIEYCDKVIASQSLHHKLSIFVTKIKSLNAEAKFRQVVDFGLLALKELGEPIPPIPNKIQVVMAHREATKLLKSASDHAILALPMMKDLQKTTCIQILQGMAMPLVHLSMSNLFALVIARVLRLTFKEGLTRWTPEVFAVAGADLIAREDDIENGFRLGELAMKLQEKLQASVIKVMVCFWTAPFSFSFKLPLTKCLDVAMEGYSSGMSYGDIHFGFHNVTAYALLYFYGGLRLRPLLEDLEKYCQQMFDYGMTNALLSILPLWQCTLNICGEQSSGPLNMTTGYAMDKQHILGNKNRVGEQATWSFSMQLYFYFDKLAEASELSQRLQGLTVGITRGEVFYPTRVFFFALIAIEQYRRTGERKHKKEAKKHADQMTIWIRGGAINLVHKGLILRAEMASLKPDDVHDTRLQYDKAFAMAMRSGFLQDAALTSLLAASFCERHFPDMVSDYAVKSWTQWMAWDAVAVADYVKKRYSDAFSASADGAMRPCMLGSGMSSSHRGRSRFSADAAKFHEKLKSSSFDMD